MTQMLRRKIPPWPCIDALELVVNCGTDQGRPKKSKKKFLKQKKQVFVLSLREKVRKSGTLQIF